MADRHARSKLRFNLRTFFLVQLALVPVFLIYPMYRIQPDRFKGTPSQQLTLMQHQNRMLLASMVGGVIYAGCLAVLFARSDNFASTWTRMLWGALLGGIYYGLVLFAPIAIEAADSEPIGSLLVVLSGVLLVGASIGSVSGGVLGWLVDGIGTIYRRRRSG